MSVIISHYNLQMYMFKNIKDKDTDKGTKCPHHLYIYILFKYLLVQPSESLFLTLTTDSFTTRSIY